MNHCWPAGLSTRYTITHSCNFARVVARFENNPDVVVHTPPQAIPPAMGSLQKLKILNLDNNQVGDEATQCILCCLMLCAWHHWLNATPHMIILLARWSCFA